MDSTEASHGHSKGSKDLTDSMVGSPPPGKLEIGDLGSSTQKGPNAKKLWLTVQNREEVLEEQVDENEQRIVIRHFLSISPNERKNVEINTLIACFEENEYFSEFQDDQLRCAFRSATLSKYRKGRAIQFQPGKGIVVLEGMLYGHRMEANVKSIETSKSPQSQQKKARTIRASAEGIHNVDHFLQDLSDEVPHEAVVDDVGRATAWLEDVMKRAAHRRSDMVTSKFRGDATEHAEGDVVILEPWMRIIQPCSSALISNAAVSTENCLIFDPRASEWVCYVAQSYTYVMEFNVPESELAAGQGTDAVQHAGMKLARGIFHMRSLGGTMGNAIVTLLAQEQQNPKPDPLTSLLAMVVGPQLTVVLLAFPHEEGLQTAALLRPMLLTKGSTVISQGEKLKQAFLLRSGEACAHVRLVQGVHTKTIELGTVSGESEDGVPAWLGAISCRDGRPETFGYSVMPTKDVEALAIPVGALRDMASKLDSSFWQLLEKREKAWSSKIADETVEEKQATPGCGYRYIVPPNERKACMVDLGLCPTWVPPPSTAAGRMEEKRRREKLEHRSRIMRSVGLEGASRNIAFISAGSATQSSSAAGEDTVNQQAAAVQENIDSTVSNLTQPIAKLTSNVLDFQKIAQSARDNETQVDGEGIQREASNQQFQPEQSSPEQEELQSPTLEDARRYRRGSVRGRFKTNDSSSPVIHSHCYDGDGNVSDWLFADSAIDPNRYTNLYEDLSSIGIFDPTSIGPAEPGISNIEVLLKHPLFSDEQQERGIEDGYPSTIHSNQEPSSPKSPVSPRGSRMSLFQATQVVEASPPHSQVVGAKRSLKQFTRAAMLASRLSKTGLSGNTVTLGAPPDEENNGGSEKNTKVSNVEEEHECNEGKRSAAKSKFTKGVTRMMTASKLSKERKRSDLPLNDGKIAILSRDRDIRWKERKEALAETFKNSPAMMLSEKSELQNSIKMECMTPEQKDSTVRRMRVLRDQVNRKRSEQNDSEVRIVADSPLVIQHLGKELDPETIADHRALMPTSRQVVRTLEQATMGFNASPKVTAKKPSEQTPSALRPAGPAPMRPSTAPRQMRTSRPSTAGSVVERKQEKHSRPKTARSGTSTCQAQMWTAEQLEVVAALRTKSGLQKPERMPPFKAVQPVNAESTEDSCSPTSLSSAIAGLASPLFRKHAMPQNNGMRTAQPSNLHEPRVFASESQFEEQESEIYMSDGCQTPTSGSWSTLPGVHGMRRVIRPAQSRPPSAKMQVGPGAESP